MFTKWNHILFVIIFGTFAGVRTVPLSQNSRVLHFGNVNEEFVPRSPCPREFEYRNDQYGVISVHSSVYNGFDTNQIQVNTYFRVRGWFDDNQDKGNLELLHDSATTISMIEMQQPIQYRIDFPRHPTMASVVNITVNGQIICMDDQPKVYGKFTIIHRWNSGTFPLQSHNARPSNTAMVDTDETTEINASREDEFPARLKIGCGKIDNKFRITHLTGDDEEIGKGTWPWLVAIYRKTTENGLLFKCTGSLLSNRIVVSAAHCFMHYDRQIKPSELVLTFGRHNLHDWSDTLRNVERIEVPKDYFRKGAGHENDSDIAILIMEEFIEYTALIRPICLRPASDTSDGEGSTGIIVGWRHCTEEDVVNVPRKLQMEIVPRNLCSPPLSNTGANKFERIFCAESKSTNGPCNGDSGSGLAIWQNDTWFLRGIVSTAIGDPIMNRYGRSKYVVLTDTSKWSAWITKWINKF